MCTSTQIATDHCFEERPEKVCYSLSRWQIKNPVKVGAVLHPDKMKSIRNGELAEFIHYVNSTFKELSENGEEGIVTLYKYFADKFMEEIDKRESNKYKLTSALANYLFQKNPEIDGLLYQSTINSSSYNIAFKSDVVDRGDLFPTHFVKDCFIMRKGPTFTEISSETAAGFNIQDDNVIWNGQD